MKRSNSLAVMIKKAAQAYYVDSTSIISDNDFDELVDQLRDISPNHPVLSSVGWGAASRDWDVPHINPMGGLDAIKYGPSNKFNFFVELMRITSITAKLDGISGTARYDSKGNLIDVLTRGDGTHGKDITTAALATGDVPSSINPTGKIVEIRGEFVLSYQQHKNMVAAGLAKSDTNLRNVASGAMRSEDTTAATYVDFVVFDILVDDLNEPLYKILESDFGVVTDFRVVTDLTDHSLHHAWNKCSPFEDNSYTYPTDGLVIHVYNNEYGSLDKFKVKFDDNPSIVVKIKVHLTTTRTGRVIPQASFEETYLDGSYISACTLNNLDWARNKFDKPIWDGSVVRIQKANQIIPEIIEVIESTPVPSNEEIAMSLGLKRWSDEGSDILDLDARDNEEVVVDNLIGHWMPKGSGDVVHNAVKLQLNNPKTIDELFSSLINNLEYNLELEGVGDHRIELINLTLNSLLLETATVPELLELCSIPSYGPTKCEKLAAEFNDNIYDISVELGKLGLGAKSRQFEDLVHHFVFRIKSVEVTSRGEDLIENIGLVRYSMTGKLNGYSKSQFDELVDAIWDDGDYEIMVTDSDRISSKMQGALDAGKRVVTSEDFLESYGKESSNV